MCQMKIINITIYQIAASGSGTGIITPVTEEQ